MASVLFVTRRFPPSVGGMQTLAADVWSSLSAEPGALLVAHGGENRTLPVFLVRALWRTLREVRRGTVDVILAGDVVMSLVLAPVARALRVRLVTLAMGKDVVWGNRAYRALVARALPRAGLVVAISERTARAVEALGVPADRVRVLRLGVRPPAVEPSRDLARRALRERLGLGSDATVLATLGRLVPRKGVAWFVGEVLDELPADWVYVVAGDGEDRAAVAAARDASADPSRVRLLGAVDDETRELVMRGCDAFVLPNLPVPGDLEGFGLVAVEAGARGALVVAADLEGLRDAVLPGRTGELVVPGDPGAWRAALVTLLGDDDRRDRADRYRRACLEEYGRERMGRELREMLRDESGHRDGRRSTTERLTVEEYQGSDGDVALAAFHVATYRFALPFVQGREVLDLGCGTGYGTAMLAGAASRVVGVDVSQDAVEHASSRYDAERLSFRAIVPGARLPFPDASFDVVTSFQVIEHVPDAAAYVDEAVRVLRPGGVLLCVTPDRTLRLFPHQLPWNEFHVTEYAPRQLAAVLEPRFASVEVLGMTAPAAMVGLELRRYRRMRLVAYPFTFPGAPRWWRLAGIRAAKRLASRRGDATAGEPSAFGPQDVVVGPGVAPSVNVVAVARRG